MYRLTDDEITMVHAIFSFIDDGRGSTETIESVSYTHLTLPTIYSV